MVETGKVQGRRELSFASLDDIVADVDRLCAAEAAGKLKRLGNWSLGQACGHIAEWMNYPYDGYPKDINPPWIVKWIVGFKRKAILSGKMSPGVKIPGIQGGTKGIDPLSTVEGTGRLRRAIERMKNTAPTMPNPLFGPLTHQEWQSMNRGHAQLHLSFFVIEK
jgi:hypothetical protein